MIDLIEEHRRKLEELCRQYRVHTLELFGSAAEGTFDPERSDLDFLVEFLPLESGQHFDYYFGLREGLQELFQREIDLVQTGAIRNPYFLKAVNESRRTVYAA